MKAKLYNQEGKELKEIELPKELFELEVNVDLIHQVLLGSQSNKRQNSAKTKDRGEVSGGGKKPWRQKGTGRARHGSIRSPLWRGGGVTFGPSTEKNYKRKLNKKMRRKAVLQVLSAKAKENVVLFIDKLEIDKPNTKEIHKSFNNLFLKKGSGLVVLPKMDKNLILSARNIEKTQTIQAKDLNVLDLLNKKFVLMPEESINVIKETFAK
jgi:large subunit ribosomal protein L4